MVMIKHGGELETQWRFERKQGDRFVSAGALTCSESEARSMVTRLAQQFGAAKAGNGATTIELEGGQRRARL